MTVPFWKLQSIGNDFPLIHIEDGMDLPELAIRMSDRRFGIGGDGLLAVKIEDGDLRLRMFNPDGTEDFCGNGIRCAVLHAHEIGWFGNSYIVRHLDQHIPVRIGSDHIVTTLNGATYDPAVVPTNSTDELFRQPYREYRAVSSLSTGSTHTIIQVDKLPEDEEFFRVSPLIEMDSLFPTRTSIIWTQVFAPMHLKIRIWERGVGETLGCGTGSSAAAMDYLRANATGGRVQVDNRGGTVFASAPTWDSQINLEGQAQTVYSGSFAL